MLPIYWAPEAEPKAVVAADRAHFYGHMHSYLCALMGMACYAEAVRDAQVMEFVRAGYEYERNFGLARVGLFGEGCTSGDMTQVAIRLSESGAGDYWEDVDSYVRNHLTEIQLIDVAQLQKATSAMNGTYANDYAAGDRDYNDVLNRIVGTVTDDSSHLTKVPQVFGGFDHLRPGQRPLGHLLRLGCDCALHGRQCSDPTAFESRLSLAGYRFLPALRSQGGDPQQDGPRLSVRIPCWANKSAVQVRIGTRTATPFWLAKAPRNNNLIN